MPVLVLDEYFLNDHIKELLAERAPKQIQNWDSTTVVGNEKVGTDAIEALLLSTLTHAQEIVVAAQKALDMYKAQHGHPNGFEKQSGAEGRVREHGVGSRELSGELGGDTRRGVTSRELSGEMGGDTIVRT